MKQTVLKRSIQSSRKRLSAWMAICALLILLTLAFNLLLVLTVSDETNSLYQWLNIASDAVCGVLVIGMITVKILPGQNLLHLAEKPVTYFEGTVSALSDRPIRYMDMDCYELTVKDRKLFLPVSSVQIRKNEAYRFALVSNLIMEAEQ